MELDAPPSRAVLSFVAKVIKSATFATTGFGAILARVDRSRFDERCEDLGSFTAYLFVVQRLAQPADLLPEEP